MQQLALITGASMGIGEEFAVQLAARKTNLILVARSEEKLRSLAEELHNRHGIQVTYFACDLAEVGAAQKVVDFLNARALHPNFLINNAGIGLVGALDSQPVERVRAMMMLNMVTLVELTQALLPQIRLSRNGRIINVASTAAFQPIPFFNVYGSTKTFVLNFTEALAEELRGTDVRVTALCPGPTPTNFHVDANINEKFMDQGQTVKDVVEMGLRGNDKGRVIVVCQRRWALYIQRIMPRFVVRYIAGFIARKMMAKM